MNDFEQRLHDAVGDLRDDLDRAELPDFKPRRSSAPAVLALLLVVGLGVAGFLSRSSFDESGSVSVATQPAPIEEDNTRSDPSVSVPSEPDPSVSGPSEPDPSVSVPSEPDPSVTTPSDGDPSDVDPSDVDPSDVDPRDVVEAFDFQLTTAGVGDFMVPSPGVSAWNADESLVLLYRTGASGGGHLVFDVASREIIAELAIPAPDIEQVYWSPNDVNVLLYTRGNELRAIDVRTSQDSTYFAFGGCDSVDSGVLPVAPSAQSAELGLLCHQGEGTSILVFDLVDSTEIRAELTSDVAPFVSPSGQHIVLLDPDGSAAVLDANLEPTGLEIDFGGDVFTFVTDLDGREWAAAAQYEGAAIGTLVLFPLQGSTPPRVVIGPETGFEYPPSGTQLSGGATKVVVAVAGDFDDALAGSLRVVSLGAGNEASDKFLRPHRSVGGFDYWSKPFVSLSPSGQFVLYSSDAGGTQVDAYVLQLSD